MVITQETLQDSFSGLNPKDFNKLIEETVKEDTTKKKYTNDGSLILAENIRVLIESNMNQLSSVEFKNEVTESIDKKLQIGGLAIYESTSRNGIFYSAEELEKAYKSLENKPILKDHVATTDNTIGLVIESSFDGFGISYKGWVKDNDVAEKITDGRIQNVSVGAIVEKLIQRKDSEVKEAIGLTFLEISTTPTPGIKNASITRRKEEKLMKAKVYKEAKANQKKTGPVTKEQMNSLRKSIKELRENDIKNKIREVKPMAQYFKVKSEDITDKEKEIKDLKEFYVIDSLGGFRKAEKITA